MTNPRETLKHGCRCLSGLNSKYLFFEGKGGVPDNKIDICSVNTKIIEDLKQEELKQRR